MVSDQEIARGVSDILSIGGHSNTATVSSVVQQVGAKLGLDLSHKSAYIADQINLFRHLHTPPSVFHNHHLYYNQPHHHALPSPFTLHFGGYPPHVHHQEQHVTSPSVNNVPPTSKDSTQTATKKRGGPGGLNKLCGVSPELQAIVGEATMSRTEIVKQLWVYIRKNNLQDPSNKRKIISDEALRVVLETDVTDMFKMNKLISKHILPLGRGHSVPPKRRKLDAESESLHADASVATEINETLARLHLLHNS
ncbi:hypothetical protein RND81_07G117000 [Saponaria officinalis]|uniref:DM2 domain-containing protein n=1 Tax=Saponaria officinalis TaxID=3572 RepID=A0AAW1JRX5_SAPOF